MSDDRDGEAARSDFDEIDRERDEKAANAKGPLAWFANNSVAANLIMLSLLIGGVLLGSRIKQEVFPEVALDFVLVNVAYPGASPEEVERAVIEPLEEGVRSVDGIKALHATAQEGVGVLTVELEFSADPDRALADIKSAVDRITNFPADVERPLVFVASNRFEVISLVIYGDKNEHELRALAETARDELLQDEHITVVELDGVRPPEVSIEIPQDKLRQYGLTLDQIAGIVRASSINLPGGGVKTDAGEVLLRTNERRDTQTEFENLALLSRADGSEVMLGEVGKVIDGFRETDREAYFNGQRAVMVKVFRVSDQTPLGISELTKKYAAKFEKELPAGVHLATWFDSSEFYEGRIDLLKRNALIGLVLVLLTLGMFLEMRLAFWVTLGIPISFIGSMVLLPSLDVSINMISLFAFIVVLGMVVDDAIVVGEAIHRRRQQGMAPLKAAIAGVREVAMPVTFAIITTIIAFAPMLFVPGISGKFFRVIPIIVISVLALSLFEGLFILPAHLAHSKQVKRGGPLGWLHSQQQRFSRGVEWLIHHTYTPLLKKAISRRYLTVAICLAVLVTTCSLPAGGRLQFTFMPKIEGDIICAQAELPFGTSVDETRGVMKKMEEAANQTFAQNGGVEASGRGMFAQVGSGGTCNRGPAGVRDSSGGHLTEVLVYLQPTGQRKLGANEFGKKWRENIGEIAGVRKMFFKSSTGADTGKPVNVELSHSRTEVLETAAHELKDRLENEGYEGVHDLDDGFAVGKVQLEFTLKPQARSLGLTELDLARQVRAAFFGSEALRQQRGRDELRVYVRLPKSERRSEYDIEQLMLRTPTGGELTLGQAADIERTRSATSIRRRDSRRVVEVTGEIDESTANANKIAEDLRETMLPDLLVKYPGLTYSFGGQQREQKQILGSLFVGFVIALVLIYALLAIAFRRYAQPLIVLTAIPFGAVGALWGHVIMGYDLSLMSMMGLVALAGVAVNDSLILVVAINEHRDMGMNTWDAVIAAGSRRFRPIILTSLTTFFGLSPMILETSLQARFLIPMAISLGFGVLMATFVTLLLVPSSYLILEDLKRGFTIMWASITGKEWWNKDTEPVGPEGPA